MERILDRINSPAYLKELGIKDLELLAQELRDEIVRVVSKTGGHLASSLGAIEATIALHKVFDMPRDRIVWDVGHQAYAHKLLTGRRKQFDTLRQLDGISGFPKREESVYDTFDTGHASTSISAALGMATARDQLGKDYKVVAFIGDASLSGGMAFEALNDAGQAGRDLLVVLNDNKMAISPRVGAMANYLSRIITDRRYQTAKADIEFVLKRVPALGKKLFRTAKRLEHTVKAFLTPGALFQELGFTYAGPVDGHNMSVLIETLENVKKLPGPRLLHIVTKKGKGYEPAEMDPSRFHGAKPFNIETGEVSSPAGRNDSRPVKASARTYSSVFGDTVLELARNDPKIVAVTAAMGPGTGLGKLAGEFPDRFFDVGIAEQHAVTFAGGMAVSGLRPIVAIYSTFLQRAYDQIVHDICLQKLPVVFAIDRAGFVGDDGPTHHGLYDLTYLSATKNLVIAAPRDGAELEKMIKWAVTQDGPVAIRYPRGAAPPDIMPDDANIERGRGSVLRKGSDVTLFAVGSMVESAIAAADLLDKDGVSAGVVDARFVLPLDVDILESVVSEVPRLVTLEENCERGGFGSAVTGTLQDRGLLDRVNVMRVAIPDDYVEQGPRETLLDRAGLSAEKVASRVKSFLREHESASVG
ncbi:MAG: 1-deoxy-D-xylulose-5-phosphate synthase [Candidatus Hydrogenedentes bacterium]|nr:1-deoxy-D-xylulose-5-phosphate synthase [Candidatus Hydrogenedentota bacterium]